MRKRDRRQGEMRPRSQRSWRDETNPRGPTSPTEEDGPAGPAEPDAALTGRADDEAAPSVQLGETSSTDGPGGGGKTEWPGRTKQHQGLRGGPSRKS